MLKCKKVEILRSPDSRDCLENRLLQRVRSVYSSTFVKKNSENLKVLRFEKLLVNYIEKY